MRAQKFKPGELKPAKLKMNSWAAVYIIAQLISLCVFTVLSVVLVIWELDLTRRWQNPLLLMCLSALVLMVVGIILWGCDRVMPVGKDIDLSIILNSLHLYGYEDGGVISDFPLKMKVAPGKKIYFFEERTLSLDWPTAFRHGVSPDSWLRGLFIYDGHGMFWMRQTARILPRFAKYLPEYSGSYDWVICYIDSRNSRELFNTPDSERHYILLDDSAIEGVPRSSVDFNKFLTNR